MIFVLTLQVPPYDTNSFPASYNISPAWQAEVPAARFLLILCTWICSSLCVRITFPAQGFTPERSRSYFHNAANCSYLF